MVHSTMLHIVYIDSYIDDSFEGSYYQSLVRPEGEFFKFIGWNEQEIFIDEEADQILSYRMTDSVGNQIAKFKFNGGPNSIEFTDTTTKKIFREFEFQPINARDPKRPGPIFEISIRIRFWVSLDIEMTESMTILLISVLSVTGFLTIVVLLVIYRRFRLTDKWDVKPEDVIFNPKTKHEDFSPEGSSDLPRTSRTTIIAGTMGNLYLPKKKFCQIAVMKGFLHNEFQELTLI